MSRVLLLDVDGVLQFADPDFAVRIERDYQWRFGYASFLRDLFADPGYLRTLVGAGDFLDVVAAVLARHLNDLGAAEFLERWLRENITPNQALLALLPEVRAERIVLAPCLTALAPAKPDPIYFRRLLNSVGCGCHREAVADHPRRGPFPRRPRVPCNGHRYSRRPRADRRPAVGHGRRRRAGRGHPLTTVQ